MKTHSVLRVWSVAIALVPLFSAAESYFLSPAGNDQNPGTLSQPWKTLDRLQRAQSVLKAGDTVYFRGGNYLITPTGSYYYSWKAAGTASAPVTYKNYNGETPSIIFDWRVAPPQATYLLFLAGSYSIVDGLQFKQTEESRLLAIDGNTVTSNYSTFKKSGIYVSANNATIRNCLVDNFSAVGIQTSRSENLLVERCTVRGTASHGFYIQSKNAVIRHNTVDGARGHSNSYNLQFQYTTSVGNKAYGNLLLNAQAAGVVFSGGISQNEVFNNVFVNAGSKPSGGYVVSFWCENSLAPAAGNKFYNNTAIGRTSTAPIATVVGTNGGTYCRSSNGGRPLAERVLIYNNIFHPSNKTPGPMANIPSMTNNIFFNVNSVPSGNDSRNPLLVNPLGTTATSAMLKAGSPAINQATNGAPPNDFLGAVRSDPDMGAFEYAGAPSRRFPLSPSGFRVR